MPDKTPAEILLEERKWLENRLAFAATVTDVGLGQGEADIAYERVGRRWNLTLRADG